MTDKPTIEDCMEQAQIFASAWSRVGSGVFGTTMEHATAEKEELEAMLRAALAAPAQAEAPEGGPIVKLIEEKIAAMSPSEASAFLAARAALVAHKAKPAAPAHDRVSAFKAAFHKANEQGVGYDDAVLAGLAAAPAQAGEYPPLGKGSLWRDAEGIRGYGADPGTGPWYTTEDVHRAIDANRAARAVYSRSMDLVRTFWQQHTKSDALSMTMAELHDDVELVIRAPQPAAQAQDADDTARLDWLTFNLSGAALRAIGVEWSEHRDARRAIDAAITAQQGDAT